MESGAWGEFANSIRCYSDPKRSRRGTAVRGTPGWDDAMLAARGQAELYAKALPVTDGWARIRTL